MSSANSLNLEQSKNLSFWKELTLSAPWAKSWSIVDGIDQDQTAQNLQSDLDLCYPLIKSDIRDTVICGTLDPTFTVVEKGRF